MKVAASFVLLMVCLVSCLAGCRSAGLQPADEESTAPESATQSTQPTQEVTITPPTTEDKPLELGETGKLRISYNGAVCGVRYITDPAQLPDYPELEAYDAVYFQNHALLLVTETVTSGSTRVDIKSAVISQGRGVVSLAYEMPDGLGTADMAAWLLWAEVEKGLDCDWVLENSKGQQAELY